MSIPNRISTTIPADVIADAIVKLTEAQNLLKPYLLAALTSNEVGSLAKLGEKSEPFADKGIEFAKTNVPFVPSWVNIPEADKDYNYFKSLRPIDILLTQFSMQVADSRIEAGAEVLDAINDFYKSVKQAHLNGIAAATPIYEELNKRYIANGRRKTIKTTP